VCAVRPLVSTAADSSNRRTSSIYSGAPRAEKGGTPARSLLNDRTAEVRVSEIVVLEATVLVILYCVALQVVSALHRSVRVVGQRCLQANR